MNPTIKPASCGCVYSYDYSFSRRSLDEHGPEVICLSQCPAHLEFKRRRLETEAIAKRLMNPRKARKATDDRGRYALCVNVSKHVAALNRRLAQ